MRGQLFPRILTERFPRFRTDILPREDQDNALARIGYGRLRTGSALLSRLRSGNLQEQVNRALLQEEHWRAASTRFSRDNIESPHNTVHVACGYPMSSVNYASFHPIFFLHHCAIDRVYERYLAMEPDSQNEFSQRQRAQARQNGRLGNLFTRPLEPFKHPVTGETFVSADTFDTKAIGYEYDSLPAAPRRRMMAPPTYAVFDDIDIIEMKKKSYMLHVFVVANSQADEFQIPTNEDRWESHVSSERSES